MFIGIFFSLMNKKIKFIQTREPNQMFVFLFTVFGSINLAVGSFVYNIIRQYSPSFRPYLYPDRWELTRLIGKCAMANFPGS